MTFQNSLVDRVIGHWSTTAGGIVLAAVAGYAWKTIAPCVPSDWAQWLAGGASVVGPVILGALSKAR